MKISIETLVSKLEETIYDKNAKKTMMLLDELSVLVAQDPISCKWVTEPINISHLHEILVEQLNVQPKAMLLKDRVPNRTHRAKLFVKCMQNGVKRVV